MAKGFSYCPQCATPLVTGPYESGGVRTRCPDAECGFVHWDNPVPVVAAIVEHHGEIVLGRNKLWPPKMFALITGFLEKDDPDPASGVLREVDEELGLKGRVVDFVGHYPFERMNQLIIAYHVVAEGEILLGDELAEYRRIAPERLRPWPGATGQALHDWMLKRGLTPLPFEFESLKAVPQYREIDRGLAIAGQPLAEQFMVIRGAGYRTVINLATPDSPGALADEAERVAAQGLRYIAIPVAWERPTAEDFALFCAAMDAERAERRKLLVHCAKAKRAAALVFLYRVLKLGVPRDEAERDLLAVWTPDAVWSAFIAERLAAGSLS